MKPKKDKCSRYNEDNDKAALDIPTGSVNRSLAYVVSAKKADKPSYLHLWNLE